MLGGQDPKPTGQGNTQTAGRPGNMPGRPAVMLHTKTHLMISLN
ncbi:hypothetical protein CLOBOL_01524 [Enterocloster bolteae ATCC BAA-613]|uniref:Uncharacterized protein n=1 Tax=Enterocloster bolteae (strain ATCC BAA-613 / DSM 15670 / CCUG 46953 / JCM 12243 / WAL 16351) TaxID=411902 RepID=A8RL74_ENTBW|nr:hypothetical protein CLOBOL_01524 [Enterocloster bolteae ATCC BAA-613]